MTKQEFLIELKAIMCESWVLARKAAKRFGGKASTYQREALRQSWAKAKVKWLYKAARNITPSAVYYLCIDEATSKNTKLLNQPLIDEVFTSRDTALAALAIARGAFSRPFLKSASHFRLH